MNLAVSHPWTLGGLCLLVLPLLNNGIRRCDYPRVSLLPEDGFSNLFSIILKLLAMAAFGSLVLGLAGLYRGEQLIERIGRGANIVLLLDRSNSMDHSFAGQAPGGGEESKSGAAKRLLTEFVRRRSNDRMGIVAYSTAPLFVMPMTQNKQAVQAAIAATDTPALAYTNISKGLAMALSIFRPQPTLSGSNIILLVSDGAAAIDLDSERKIRQWVKQQPVRLYWIFLRGKNSPGLYQRPEDPRDDNAQAMPERYLHIFFKSLGVPYKAYQAENPDALQKAIEDIDRFENRSLQYREKVPRQDLSGYCYFWATVMIGLLLAGKLSEARP